MGPEMMLLAEPFMGAMGQGLGSALGGQSGPTVSGVEGVRTEAVFDNSGWNQNFGDGEIRSDRQQLPALGGMDTTTIILWLAGGLIAWKIWNKRKK